MPTPFQLLQSGEIASAVVSVYTNVIGAFFYLFLMLMVIIAVYMKSEKIEMVGLVMALMGGFAFGSGTTAILYLPMEGAGMDFSLVGFYFFLMCVGLGLILSKWFRRKSTYT